jgi:hypothetical protein
MLPTRRGRLGWTKIRADSWKSFTPVPGAVVQRRALLLRDLGKFGTPPDIHSIQQELTDRLTKTVNQLIQSVICL